jgi:hypothetical protein
VDADRSPPASPAGLPDGRVDLRSSSAGAFRSLVVTTPLPDPGAGRTMQRFEGLRDVSRTSLSLGRLFEGHADAVAILHEAGMDPPPGTGAVWASEGPAHAVVVRRQTHGFVIEGRKSFCSGASMVEWALVTGRLDGEVVLAAVHLDPGAVSIAPPEWVGPGMGGADTRSVCFADAPVIALVGGPQWYLDRPGFWHGAVGVAACWWGGALGVLHTMRRTVHDEPHALALLGEAEADAGSVEAVLSQAATEIDRDPFDHPAAHRRALVVRAVVERACRAILDHSALALGPRPLALDPDHSARVADLQVYLRQHHGRRDLESLGRLATGREGQVRTVSSGSGRRSC